MLHAPDWIVAWRLGKAYNLSSSDIFSLTEVLANSGHVSLHPTWNTLKTQFLFPQVNTPPPHWRSIFDGGIQVDESWPWLKRVWIGEKDYILDMLRIVAVHIEAARFENVTSALLKSIYEGEPFPISAGEFCAPFAMPNGKEVDRIFSQVFIDSFLFNKREAVMYVENACYPFISEVKGITQQYVKSVLAESANALPVATNVSGPTAPPAHEEEAETQVEADGQPDKLEREGVVSEQQEQVVLWEFVLSEVKKKHEKEAAKLAIEKWNGLTHDEAYKKLFKRKQHENPIEFVSKKRKIAKNLHSGFVKKYPKLKMPDWQA